MNNIRYRHSIVILICVAILSLQSCGSRNKTDCSAELTCKNGSWNNSTCKCDCNTGWKGVQCDVTDSNDNYFKAVVSPSKTIKYDFASAFNNVLLEYYNEVSVYDSLVVLGTDKNSLSQPCRIEIRIYLDFDKLPSGLVFTPSAIHIIYIDNGEEYYMERGNEETIEIESLNVSTYAYRLIKGRFNHIQCFNKDKSKSALLLDGSFYFKP